MSKDTTVSFESAAGKDLLTTARARSRRPYAPGVQVTRKDVGGFGSSFFNILPNPDLVLRKLGRNINDYKDLMTDSQVYSCWQNRIAGVKALEYAINVDDVDTEQSEFIKRVFASLKMPYLLDAILEAILYGVQFLEIYWQPQGGKIVPTAIVAKPREWFVFNDRNEPRLRSKVGNTSGEALWERKWLIVQHNPSYENPYGEAILSRCWWPVQFKKNSWKFLMRFGEKLGTPFLVGKTNQSPTDEEIDALYEDLEGLRQDGVIVTPEDVEIMILEASKGSGDLFAKIIQDCRVEITQAILSHTSATQSTEGKLGQDHTAMAVRDDIVKGDRQLAEDTINKFIRWTIDANFYETSKYPTFQLIEKQALEKGRAERDDLMTKNKQVRFTKQYYTRHYGLEEDEIEIVEEPAAPSGATLASPSASPAPIQGQNAEPTGTFEEPSDEPVDNIAINLAVQNLLKSPDSINAMKSIQEQLVKAISKGSSYEEVNKLLAPLVGKIKTTELETVVANAVFAADTVARLQVSNDTKQTLQKEFTEPNTRRLWATIAPARIQTFKESKPKGKEYPAPANSVQWEALRTMNEAALRRRGLGAWSNEEGDPAKGLMLFPGAWYDAIPEGFAVVDIFGEAETFKRGQSDNDTRFGFLPYGIIAKGV